MDIIGEIINQEQEDYFRMENEEKKSTKEPVIYILNGQEYRVKNINLETICQDIASRKDEEARRFIRENQNANFLTLRKEYLKKWGQKAQTAKDKALALLDW